MRELKNLNKKQRYTNSAMLGVMVVALIVIVIISILMKAFYNVFPIEADLVTIMVLAAAYAIKQLIDCVVFSYTYRKEVMKGR